MHLIINNFQPKIDEIYCIATQANASIIGISESKLDSSILNREVDIEDYDLIRVDHSSRRDAVACYFRKLSSYNHKSSF